MKNCQDQLVKGGFYEKDLTEAKYSDVYLVETVLRKRGNQIYVKCLGFDNTHCSWINESEIYECKLIKKLLRV